MGELEIPFPRRWLTTDNLCLCSSSTRYHSPPKECKQMPRLTPGTPEAQLPPKESTMPGLYSVVWREGDLGDELRRKQLILCGVYSGRCCLCWNSQGWGGLGCRGPFLVAWAIDGLLLAYDLSESNLSIQILFLFWYFRLSPSLWHLLCTYIDR